MTKPPLVLTPEQPNATITISIVDDILVETNESFGINIFFLGEPAATLKLNTSTAIVVILENDGRCCLWITVIRMIPQMSSLIFLRRYIIYNCH